MRMRAGVLLLLAVGFLMAAATKNRDREYSQQMNLRPRLREIRGYKPERMATAIGFGKRGDPPKNHRYDKMLSILLQNSARGSPEEGGYPSKLRSNPIMMGKLIQFILDLEQTDAPTMIAVPESDRIISLI